MPRINIKFPERSKTPRGLKWCKACSRKHHRTEYCKHYYRTRTAKSGREVKRWAA